MIRPAYDPAEDLTITCPFSLTSVPADWRCGATGQFMSVLKKQWLGMSCSMNIGKQQHINIYQHIYIYTLYYMSTSTYMMHMYMNECTRVYLYAYIYMQLYSGLTIYLVGDLKNAVHPSSYKHASGKKEHKF